MAKFRMINQDLLYGIALVKNDRRHQHLSLDMVTIHFNACDPLPSSRFPFVHLHTKAHKNIVKLLTHHIPIPAC